jgi:hypothetical protein
MDDLRRASSGRKDKNTDRNRRLDLRLQHGPIRRAAPWPPGTQIRLVSAVEQSDLIQEYFEEEKVNAYQRAGAAIKRAAAILRDSPNEFEIITEIFARRIIWRR